MNVLLNTNELSEVPGRAPDPGVLVWLDALDEDRVFISFASMAVLRRGIALIEDGRRRAALAAWLADDLPSRFAGRVLTIDPAIAERWGDLMAAARRGGIGLSAMDGFFAATVAVHGLTLATHNLKDFGSPGVALFNPWSHGGELEEVADS